MTEAHHTEYVNIRHAGEIAGVSRRTIYNWLAEGKLSYVRTAGGSVRIDRAGLLIEPARRIKSDDNP